MSKSIFMQLVTASFVAKQVCFVGGKTRNTAIQVVCSNFVKQVARFTLAKERISVACSLTVWLTERSKERSEARVKSKSGEIWKICRGVRLKRFVQESHASALHPENRILRTENPTVLESKKKKNDSLSVYWSRLLSRLHEFRAITNFSYAVHNWKTCVVP